ncbi:MAG: site-2 protease family protein [Gemmatimonadota bacterium]|nr:MAG: site-2 protease family protein [Gemmatimonadota bacterium]
MKWSWKLGEFAGIGVYMHATFLLLLAWVGVTHWIAEQSPEAVLFGIGFILAIFLCVVLHEFGHALTARRYGIRTRDITLLPIGGVARLERMPDKPIQELWVALAGPAVNVVIAVLLLLAILAVGGFQPVDSLSMISGPILERLLIVNVILVVFNMIPAFPMDGGRVLRALLALRLDYTRATQVAAGLGQAIALLFGFLGLFANPLLLFIAFFVWIGAAQESSMAQMRSSLGGIPVSHAMLTDFRSLSPRDPLARAIELILAGSQQDFPVVEEGRIVGVLTRGDLLSAVARSGQSAIVADVMRRDIQVVDALEMLETAFNRLQRGDCRTLPVMQEGRLVGLLTSENIGEFLMIRSALGRAVGARA